MSIRRFANKAATCARIISTMQIMNEMFKYCGMSFALHLFHKHFHKFTNNSQCMCVRMCTCMMCIGLLVHNLYSFESKCEFVFFRYRAFVHELMRALAIEFARYLIPGIRPTSYGEYQE